MCGSLDIKAWRKEFYRRRAI